MPFLNSIFTCTSDDQNSSDAGVDELKDKISKLKERIMKLEIELGATRDVLMEIKMDVKFITRQPLNNSDQNVKDGCLLM